MTEQRVNGLGQVVELDSKTGRWVPVKELAPADEIESLQVAESASFGEFAWDEDGGYVLKDDDE